MDLSILNQAAQTGNLEIVKHEIEVNHVYPEDGYNYVIQLASQNGHSDVVQYLSLVSDVNLIHYDCAIQRASRNGHLEVVYYLSLLLAVNPAADDNFAIRVASKNGHFSTVKFLALLLGPNTGSAFDCAICLASENGHLEVVQFLEQETFVRKNNVNHEILNTLSFFPEIPQHITYLYLVNSINPIVQENYSNHVKQFCK